MFPMNVNETKRIKNIVLSLKGAITNLNPAYDNFDSVAAVYFDSFKISIETLFPECYFAVRENDLEEYEIAIFDDEETRDAWIERNNEDYECYKISEKRFWELSQDEWDDPDCYSEEDGVLMFRLI